VERRKVWSVQTEGKWQDERPVGLCFPEKAEPQMQGRTHVNIYTITLVVFPYRTASVATGIPRRTV